MIRALVSSTVRPDVREQAVLLASEAAQYDQEAGFGDVSEWFGESSPARAYVTIHHRDGWDRDEEFVLAAVGAVVPEEGRPGRGWLHYVVRPDKRALGITTLAAEALGLNGAGGAVGVELEIEDGLGIEEVWTWALASHPAADRFARRFGIASRKESWLVTALVDATGGELPPGWRCEEAAENPAGDWRREVGVIPAELATEGDASHRSVLDPEGRRRAGFSVRARMHHRNEHTRTSVLDLHAGDGDVEGGGMALAAARLEARAMGASMVEIHVDPAQESMVRALRLRGFEVEDIHTCYSFDLPAAIAARGA